MPTLEDWRNVKPGTPIYYISWDGSKYIPQKTHVTNFKNEQIYWKYTDACDLLRRKAKIDTYSLFHPSYQKAGPLADVLVLTENSNFCFPLTTESPLYHTSYFSLSKEIITNLEKKLVEDEILRLKKEILKKIQNIRDLESGAKRKSLIDWDEIQDPNPYSDATGSDTE